MTCSAPFRCGCGCERRHALALAGRWSQSGVAPSLQYCVKTKFAGYALVTRACESPGEPAPKDLDALRFPAQMAIERRRIVAVADHQLDLRAARSEEHTSELQSLMRSSYAVL